MHCLNQSFQQILVSVPDPAFEGRKVLAPRIEDREKAGEREKILCELLRNAPLHGEIQNKLGKLIVAAVACPGGLFRYELTRQTARAFGCSASHCETFACAVEYFHIASLLLDDLPVMDNSMERRGQICPHLLFGEDTAILGSLGLITRAYGLLGEVIASAPAESHRSAHALIEKCLGTAGILNGQARDLNFKDKGGTCEAISVAIGKTMPLIHLALSGPAVLGGASARTQSLLRRLSLCWGLCYQGIDDLKDLLQPAAVSGKTAGCDGKLGRPNMALLVGIREARRYIERLIRLAQSCISELALGHPGLAFLNSFQESLRARSEMIGAHQ